MQPITYNYISCKIRALITISLLSSTALTFGYNCQVCATDVQACETAVRTVAEAKNSNVSADEIQDASTSVASISNKTSALRNKIATQKSEVSTLKEKYSQAICKAKKACSQWKKNDCAEKNRKVIGKINEISMQCLQKANSEYKVLAKKSLVKHNNYLAKYKANRKDITEWQSYWRAAMDLISSDCTNYDKIKTKRSFTSLPKAVQCAACASKMTTKCPSVERPLYGQEILSDQIPAFQSNLETYYAQDRHSTMSGFYSCVNAQVADLNIISCDTTATTPTGYSDLCTPTITSYPCG